MFGGQYLVVIRLSCGERGAAFSGWFANTIRSEPGACPELVVGSVFFRRPARFLLAFVGNR